MVEKDLINVSEEMSVIHEKMFDNKVHHLQNGFSDVQRAVILITQAPKYQLYNILACKKYDVRLISMNMSKIQTFVMKSLRVCHLDLKKEDLSV